MPSSGGVDVARVRCRPARRAVQALGASAAHHVRMPFHSPASHPALLPALAQELQREFVDQAPKLERLPDRTSVTHDNLTTLTKQTARI